jgi:gluconokinase
MNVLTIDIGSSSLRTNLFDGHASQLAGLEAQVHYDVRATEGGGVEIDPDALAQCLFSAIDRTLAGADQPEKPGGSIASIEGVGFCSLVSNVLGIDKNGRPTTPIYTWADTRCAPQAEALRRELDEANVHRRTGCRIHTSYLPARFVWLRETMPEAYARTAHWISLADYIYLLLLGRYEQSLSVASWDGLLNRKTLDWDEQLLEQIGLERESLPALVDAYDGVQGLKPEFAKRWPALKDAQWFRCVGDGATSNLGSGCYTPGDWGVQVGTSAAMRAFVPSGVEHVPSGLWCYRLDRQTELLGGALSEGGNLLAWLRNNLGFDDFSVAEREAASMAPDSHGLTLLPFIAGERSTGWNPAARMHIAGISLATTPADILRAAQEAIVYGFAAVFDMLVSALRPEGNHPARIPASGGALLNTPGWMQILADALGSPVTASGEEQASSKGAAMIALRALGHLRDFSEVPASFGPTFQPDMSRHAIYRRAMARRQELYEREIQGLSPAGGEGAKGTSPAGGLGTPPKPTPSPQPLAYAIIDARAYPADCCGKESSESLTWNREPRTGNCINPSQPTW